MRWKWWRRAKPVVEEAVVPSCCWFDDDESEQPTQIIWRVPRAKSIGQFTTIAPAPGRHAR